VQEYVCKLHGTHTKHRNGDMTEVLIWSDRDIWIICAWSSIISI